VKITREEEEEKWKIGEGFEQENGETSYGSFIFPRRTS
jgi:hypothetical protein